MPRRPDSGDGHSGPLSKPPPALRLPTIVFAVLVIATVGAFAFSQRLKRDPLVLDRVEFFAPPHMKGQPKVRSFTPNSDCRRDRIRIKFRTTVSDRGTVQVIKPGGRVVVTLDRDTFLKRYTFHVYYWDGRQRGGGKPPPGRYKLRVRLGDRTLVPGGVMRLHDSPRRPTRDCDSKGGSS